MSDEPVGLAVYFVLDISPSTKLFFSFLRFGTFDRRACRVFWVTSLLIKQGGAEFNVLWSPCGGF
ncbi:MAG: hypothetical protein A2583_08220 [Bdellovibrionales bacterium RIFOXYD1_FULL_53_11]|nr:MAG: hypothetical protein A2583_08220 [Bdellovibrionales bacterium RIFOXYD1_FULL_53_11]